MIVYNINKSIGRASSGVEYAQAYRNQVVSQLDVTQRYLFTDFIANNIVSFTSKLGFDNEEIIWIYGFLAGQKNHASSYSIEKFEATISANYQKNTLETAIEYKDSTSPFSYKIWLTDNHFVEKVERIENEQVQQVSHYTDRLNYEAHYVEGKLSHRVFFDEAELPVYTQYYQEKEISVTIFKERILYGKAAFLEAFFEELRITNEDFIILDRSLDLAPEVLKNSNQAKVAVVIHAEHYNAKKSVDGVILWNNFYEYVFTNHQFIDYFITATEGQKELVEQQLKQTDANFASQVVAIPVGVAQQRAVQPLDESKQFKLMTASRLADEKHVDYVISAVIEARKTVPELTLAIYGEGKNKQALTQLIQKRQATAFIQLKGHQELAEVYQEYGGYVTASLSEGFGLSLLEALSNGLVFVGYDVAYGNREFIENEQNGLLVTYEKEKQPASALAVAIAAIYSPSFDFEKARQRSYQRAAAFAPAKIQAKWQALFFNKEPKS